MLRFIVIGITDNPAPWFPPEVMEIIKNGKVFSGGKRHHEIVAPLLPQGAKWIDITTPLDAVFEQYKSLSPSPSPVREGRKVTSVGTQAPFPNKVEREATAEGTQAPFPNKVEREATAEGTKLPLPNKGGASGEALVVFASGDPLFYGFANTIQRMMPEAEIQVYPAFNSLQLLAHRLLLPYHDMRIVSLTGRPWQEFDRALIERVEKIGVLTDKEHTPATIAQRMLDYGYTYYSMHVGEHLGNPEKERITTLTLEEAASLTFAMPNCIILHANDHSLNTKMIHDHSCATQGHAWSIPNHSCSTLGHSCFNHPPCRVFGIPDHAFALLDGREKMITKMPIRLLTLQALDLPHRHVLWDIGACTGSVSIEARLLFPHLRIEAFEIRPECEAIIQENCRRHGTPGITLHIGDFLKATIPPLNATSNTPPLGVPSNTLSLSVGCGTAAASSTSPLPLPDAVFIGGHGGHLKAIMAKVAALLAPGGIIVMNSVKAPLVKTDSHKLWKEACAELGLTQAPPLHIQLDDYHPIDILKAVKPSSPPL